jgi:hypothetical protein
MSDTVVVALISAAAAIVVAVVSLGGIALGRHWERHAEAQRVQQLRQEEDDRWKREAEAEHNRYLLNHRTDTYRAFLAAARRYQLLRLYGEKNTPEKVAAGHELMDALSGILIFSARDVSVKAAEFAATFFSADEEERKASAIPEKELERLIRQDLGVPD